MSNTAVLNHPVRWVSPECKPEPASTVPDLEFDMSEADRREAKRARKLVARSRAARKNRRDDEGQRPTLSVEQHNRLMDRGVVPHCYWIYSLSRAERRRIRGILKGEYITRDHQRMSRKMCREVRTAIVTT